MKKILINKVEYILKNKIRNFFIYEELKGVPYAFGKLIDDYLLFYSTLIANNESFSMAFDDFINVCDEEPSLFAEYKQFITSEIIMQSQAASKEKNDSKKKKKR